MPWKILSRNGKFCVYKHDEGGRPVGKTLGCHPTRKEAAAQLRALYANEAKASPLQITPVNEIDLSDDEAERLMARYVALISGLRGQITILLPGMAEKPPVQVRLPRTIEEYADITEAPMRQIEQKYASTNAQKAHMVFSPRHQKDMLPFDGKLSAASGAAIDAVTTVVHEVMHLGLRSELADRAERVVVESATDVCSLLWTAHYMPNVELNGPLFDGLRKYAAYADYFPWFSDLLLAFGGSGEGAAKAALDIISGPSDQAVDVLINLLSENFEMRKPDALEYLSVKQFDYDDQLNGIKAQVRILAKKVTGQSEDDSLRWLIEHAFENGRTSTNES